MTEMHPERPFSRREMMYRAGAGLAVGTVSAVGLPVAVAEESSGGFTAESLRYCLNTGTIRGQKLPLQENVRIAAKAGYNAIEPWIQEIAEFTGNGGSLADLKKRIDWSVRRRGNAWPTNTLTK